MEVLTATKTCCPAEESLLAFFNYVRQHEKTGRQLTDRKWNYEEVNVMLQFTKTQRVTGLRNLVIGCMMIGALLIGTFSTHVEGDGLGERCQDCTATYNERSNQAALDYAWERWRCEDPSYNDEPDQIRWCLMQAEWTYQWTMDGIEREFWDCNNNCHY